MKKNTWGGKRQGAGKKKQKETSTISFRHLKNVINSVRKKYKRGELAKLAKEWLDHLAK